MSNTKFQQKYKGTICRPVISCADYDGPRTSQAHKDECDINHIMKRYVATGQPLPAQPQQLFTEVPNIDFKTALDYAGEVKRAFLQLPSEIRQKMDNQPQNYLDFLRDPQGSKWADLLLGPVEQRPPEKTPPEASQEPSNPPPAGAPDPNSTGDTVIAT